ncbi:MAG: hypothetical protein JNN30_13845 [Rhodanobacteraceae bacterium]|nr:hypothetical protein [Rhodanobacteraceae bacterium]
MAVRDHTDETVFAGGQMAILSQMITTPFNFYMTRTVSGASPPSRNTILKATDRREEVSVNGGEPRQVLSRWQRIAGGIVVLATGVVVAVPVLWVFCPNLLTGSRRIEGLAVCVLVASLVVSGAGGLIMSAMTRNLWWLLTLLATGGAVVFWFLIGAAMGALMH